jgi:predicted membrane channel-forming protein YqfA (hemolysin III family)
MKLIHYKIIFEKIVHLYACLYFVLCYLNGHTCQTFLGAALFLIALPVLVSPSVFYHFSQSDENTRRTFQVLILRILITSPTSARVSICILSF